MGSVRLGLLEREDEALPTLGSCEGGSERFQIADAFVVQEFGDALDVGSVVRVEGSHCRVSYGVVELDRTNGVVLAALPGDMPQHDVSEFGLSPLACEARHFTPDYSLV